LNSLAAVIHKNKLNATGNSEKVLHPRNKENTSVKNVL